MRQTLSFRRIFLAAMALLSVVATGPAVAGTPPAEQQGGCPDAMPGHDLAMAGQTIRRYRDYKTNPAHTRRQFERGLLDLDRRTSCRSWVAGTAIVGVTGYQVHQDPPDLFSKKASEIDAVKKGLDRMPEDRVPTAIENLEKKMTDAAIDLAYQGRSKEEIVRRLYCECVSDYPGAAAFDKKAAERRREDIDSDE